MKEDRGQKLEVKTAPFRNKSGKVDGGGGGAEIKPLLVKSTPAGQSLPELCGFVGPGPAGCRRSEWVSLINPFSWSVKATSLTASGSFSKDSGAEPGRQEHHSEVLTARRRRPGLPES